MNSSNTSPRSFSADRLRAALGEVGGPARPDYLTDIVAQAGRTRQRPAWTFAERWLSVDIAAPNQGVPRAVVVVSALALLITLLAGIVYVGSLRLQPERPPVLSLGIFEPAAGRIVFHGGGPDRGYDAGLWAVDPISPSVSTLVRIGAEGDYPLGWSSDGSKLLLQRKDRTTQDSCCRDFLFIRDADGTDTQLNRDAVYLYGATIAPDGSRVVFGAGDYRGHDVALFAIDGKGGEVVELIADGSEPAFSPDGTKLAYLASGGGRVVIANADGSDAQVVLAGESFTTGGNSFAWSPAGDRIAIGVVLAEDSFAIYTFAPDGSDFKQVIARGLDPFWSPDGSRIAYSIWDDPIGGGPLRLAIADADGSDVREFEFGASGPWHPVVVETIGLGPVGAP